MVKWHDERSETMTTKAEEQQVALVAIPWDTALQICSAIQAKNRHRWYTPSGMMCRGCVTFSKGDPAKMCFASQPDNRGCYQVNERFDQQLGANKTSERATQ
jgi:hypothetical protein